MENETTVLIVDDEEIGREALEGVLFTERYNLIFASNGTEAYEKAVQYMPDVILLDVMMPGTDGFQVCQKIRSNSLIAEVPIIIITALDDRDSRVKGLEAGADDFLTKPFDRYEIRARVRTIVRLNRYRRLVLERVRFSWVVEQAREGYVALDSDGNIIYSNRAAKNLLGLPVDAPCLPFMEYVKNRYRLEPEENWTRWLEASDINLYLIQPETEQNPLVILNAEVLELPLGVQKKVLVRITDATAQIKREQELWSFHQAVSHKLATPISHFIMAAQLINRQADNPDPENIKELSEMMIEGGRNLQSAVQEILLYTRISDVTKAEQKLHLSTLSKLIHQLCEDMGVNKCRIEGKLELKNYSLNISCRAAEVIFRELLGNAKKFHPQLSPTVDIRLQIYEETNVLIAVADDGISIPPDQLSAVWQPYFQVEKVFSGNISGMGLGLPSVAKLVWGAGGKCRMYNQAEKPGIVIELILPIYS